METYYALLSVVFMICFVVMFDRVHQHRRDALFCSNRLLRSSDVDRIMRILSACAE